MSKLRLIPYAVLTAGSMVAGGGAYAQSMYDINQRQDYQQDRIDRGVRDGQITRSEQYRLEQGERAIDRHIDGLSFLHLWSKFYNPYAHSCWYNTRASHFHLASRPRRSCRMSVVETRYEHI